ncbi:MAG: hypothetical protein NC131_18985, partial [Roseburia sp.]|nr:hypothetical protein [Roseburia sp.]
DGIIHGFDYARCKTFLQRNGYPDPRPAEFVDVMKMIERVMRRTYKLTVAFKKMGLSEDIANAINMVYFGTGGKAHESSYDTVMTAMLFQKLYADGQYQEGSGGVTWLSDSEKQEKQTEWFLFFDGMSLKAMSVTAVEDSEDIKVFTIEELMSKDIQTFDYLMKNPESHMCKDHELLNTVLNGGFVNV